jgi:enterochelin esterase-like enzyme
VSHVEPAHVEPNLIDIQPAWSARDDENGCTLVHFENFPSNHVLDRHVDVYLPASYGEIDENKKGKRYPVLYMHDGQNCFDPSSAAGGVDWRVGKTVARLAAIKSIPEMIVVGVWNTYRRIPEYLPERPFRRLLEEDSESSRVLLEQFREKYSQYMPEGEDACSDSYLKFLVTEVKPFVDDAFRTRPEQRHTSIMGSSMGGLASCYALCEYPNVFYAAGCISTHWPILEGTTVDFLENHDEFGIPSPENHKFYFDFGTNSPDDEYEKFQSRIDRVMEKKGYKWAGNFFTEKFEGDDHSEMCWRNRLFLPLMFLFGNPLV